MPKNIPEPAIDAIIEWFKERLSGSQNNYTGAYENQGATKKLYQTDGENVSEKMGALSFFATATTCNELHEGAIKKFCDELKILLLQHDFENPPSGYLKAYCRQRNEYRLILVMRYGPDEDYYLRTASEEAGTGKFAFPLMTYIYIYSDGYVMSQAQGHARIIYQPQANQTETFSNT